LALARHNDYREGHENKDGNAFTLTPLLVINEANAVILQAQMDKVGFAGEASITANIIPAGCQMSVYEEKGGDAAVKNLDKSHAATDSWYGGFQHYDYATNGYKAGLTDTQKKKAEAFTRMLWRGTQTVAFGVKGRWVAAWYCNPSGSTNANKAGAFKDNVMRSCLKPQPPTAANAD
jgi:hypothetical protein